VDAAGNVYTAGVFENSLTLGTTRLTSAGDHDAFVAKYSPAGNLVWASRVGGTGYDEANGITVDATGNVYMSGSFQGTVTFGGTSLTSAGQYSEVVVKLNGSSGVVQWAGGVGPGDNNVLWVVAVDGAGRIYAAGSFRGVTNADPGPGTFNLTSDGGG